MPNFQLMKDMTEPELREHMNLMCRAVTSLQAPDALGMMLVVFQDNGIVQYGSSIEPETAPQALRELAERIERRQTVTR